MQTALIPVKDLALQWSFYNFLDPCHVGIWVIPFMSGQEEGEEQLSCGIRKISMQNWPDIALKYRVSWFFPLGDKMLAGSKHGENLNMFQCYLFQQMSLRGNAVYRLAKLETSRYF